MSPRDSGLQACDSRHGLPISAATHEDSIANQRTVREDYSHDGDAWSRKYSFLMAHLVPRTNKLRQTSLTTTPDRAHSDGAKTVSPVSVTLTVTKTLASVSGTRKSPCNAAIEYET